MPDENGAYTAEDAPKGDPNVFATEGDRVAARGEVPSIEEQNASGGTEEEAPVPQDFGVHAEGASPFEVARQQEQANATEGSASSDEAAGPGPEEPDPNA